MRHTACVTLQRWPNSPVRSGALFIMGAGGPVARCQRYCKFPDASPQDEFSGSLTKMCHVPAPLWVPCWAQPCSHPPQPWASTSTLRDVIFEAWIWTASWRRIPFPGHHMWLQAFQSDFLSRLFKYPEILSPRLLPALMGCPSLCPVCICQPIHLSRLFLNVTYFTGPHLAALSPFTCAPS